MLKQIITPLFVLCLLSAALANEHPPDRLHHEKKISETIQDDESAFIVVFEDGSKREEYYASDGSTKQIDTDALGNIFTVVFDSDGAVVSESMPDELIGESDERNVRSESFLDDKGYAVVYHYDSYDRIVRIVEQLPFDYMGISEYTFYDKMQAVERDGLTGYEWVIKTEYSYLSRNDDAKASIYTEYSKQREVVKKDTKGLTVMFPVIQMIARVFGYEVSREDLENV